MYVDNVQLYIASDALKDVANRLGLKILSPAVFDECLGNAALEFIYHFGSPNGVLLDSIAAPAYKCNSVLQGFAQENNMYYSKVNVDQLANYDDDDFIELFRDWGYYGGNPPPWIRNSNGGVTQTNQRGQES